MQCMCVLCVSKVVWPILDDVIMRLELYNTLLLKMHSVEELGNNVPAFLAKLWTMVEDPETNDLICWSSSGSSFFIRNQARFSRELLPHYYKHNNMASFVRQLNMYGFHKVVSIEGGGLKVDRDEMEFAHHCFLMGRPYLMERIKRKISNNNKTEEGRTGTKPELVNKVLSEVKSLKGRQDSVDSQLSAMKRENEVLWREVAILRQKHLKQQQIVNKLIQFLVSMVQTSRGSGIGIKRHYPLMLSDIADRPRKAARKMNGNIADMSSMASNLSPTGPVIHELDTAELLDDCVPNTDDEAPEPEFLETDLCGAVNSGPNNTPAPVTINIQPTTASTSALDNTNQEVLLELSEECPSMMLIPPSSAPSYTASAAKPTKGRKSAGLKGAKRRKSRSGSTSAAKWRTSNPMVAVKMEQAEEDDPVSVNNFLEIMLPTLVSDNGETVTGLPEPEVELPEPSLLEAAGEQEPSALAAATDEAISAISSVAAAAAAAAATAPPDRSAGLPAGTVPVAGSTSADQGDAEEGSSSKDLTLACAGPNALADPFKSKDELDGHLDSMQTELESLKELLKGEGYNLDANMLLGVCAAAGLGHEVDVMKLFGDDSLSYGIPIMQEETGNRQNKENGVSDPLVSGSELMTYSSNLLDLADMSSLDDWTSPTPLDSFSDTCSEVNTPAMSVNSPSPSGSVGKKRKK